jgi:tripartite-type tricarboxylate transporter receptor subunit TctC
MRDWVAAAVAAALATWAAWPAEAAWPERPVTLVVGFPPAGVTDISARMIAAEMSALWGQPVNVENRPGASTTVAASMVLAAPPDGYVLFQNSSTQVAAKLVGKQVSFDPVNGFTPISKVLSTSNVILAARDTPARTLGELVALAKAAPGTLHYGNPGYGTITHLGAELFKQMAGIDMVGVAYRGGGPSVQALAKGEVEASFNTVPEAMAKIRAGEVRALAVTTAARDPALPGVPTVAETVPGYEVEVWQAWLGPPGMPPDLVDRISQSLATALRSPGLRAKLEDVGARPIGSTPAELRKTMEAELARWTAVVKAAGIAPE